MTNRLQTGKFVLGTVNTTTGGDLSVRPNPMQHHTQGQANTEAERLLTSGQVSQDRSVVVLQVVGVAKRTNISWE